MCHILTCCTLKEFHVKLTAFILSEFLSYPRKIRIVTVRYQTEVNQKSDGVAKKVYLGSVKMNQVQSSGLCGGGTQQLPLDLTETLRGHEASWMSPDVTQTRSSGPGSWAGRLCASDPESVLNSAGTAASLTTLPVASIKRHVSKSMLNSFRARTLDQIPTSPSVKINVDALKDKLVQLDQEKADQVIRRSGDQSLKGSNREEDASSVHLNILSVTQHQMEVLLTRSRNLKFLKLEYLLFIIRIIFSSLPFGPAVLDSVSLFTLRGKLRRNQNGMIFSRWTKSLKWEMCFWRDERKQQFVLNRLWTCFSGVFVL